MNPSVLTHIQRLRWISETEQYLARVRQHLEQCPHDMEARDVIRMVEGALAKARSEVGMTDGPMERPARHHSVSVPAHS